MGEFSQLLLLYLLSGRHSNGLGCYSLPMGYVCADLKKGFDTVSKGFKELYQNGWAYHCEHTEFVLIPKFLKWNAVANPKIAIARQKEFDDIPSSFTYRPDLARALLKYGGHFKPEFETLLHTLSDTVSETLSKQEQERNKRGTRDNNSFSDEKADEKNEPEKQKSKYSDQFEDLWKFAKSEYSKVDHPTGNKTEAWEAFKKLKPTDSDLKHWCNRLRLQADAKRALINAGGSPANLKNFCRWIKFASWEDEPDPAPKDPGTQAPVNRKPEFIPGVSQ